MAVTQDKHWKEAQRIRIKGAFALFDKDKKGTILPEEVSTAMRYLGAYPTEKAMVEEILPDIQGDDPSAAVPYFEFEAKMLEIIASRTWDPDPSEVLLRAFRTIDEAGVGYIETAKMNELLMTKGTPFRAKEIEAFLSVAKVVKIREQLPTSQLLHCDPETGHIYFEDYVASLASDT